MGDDPKFRLHDAKSGAAITVRVDTRGKANRITRIDEDGTIFVSIPGPLEQVNRGLIAYLAGLLQIKPAQMDIIAGQGQDRLISILGLNAEQVSQRLLAAVGKVPPDQA
jgi:uncharacterized protein YggU (UPF0235/DUF167 family)